jgi:serine/threonine protein kinase
MIPDQDGNQFGETRPFKVLSPGTMISHYKIIEKIGEGGMGVVYKAEDVKLKRHVALKFLPPHLTRNTKARERFLIEAQAASALDHPNICTIHEIDETPEGMTFISMACYEGETLRERIGRGPIEVEEVVSVATKLASGLAKAHEKGIVHRDIKPANIMITPEGIVKIMDFGLAKLAGQAAVTRTGNIMGTVAYMSPEQARGESVDQRSDIWSLGVVLYEMLTGARPFKGDHEQAILYSILNEDPKPLASFRPDIPDHVAGVVLKALERDPSKRYPDMVTFRQELASSTISSAAESKMEKSIVVLPFEDLSPDRNNEYFSDGLTEEIITDLSSIRGLRVISRTSAMRLKATQKDIREIGRELDVQYVLEGSVRKAGANIRIAAQLIDAVADSHLWANKYSGTLEDIFDIQESVSRSIADAIKVKLSPDEDARMGERLIENAQAYEYYLKARHEVYKFTADALERALTYLKAALEIEGPNALLYAEIGHVYYEFWNSGVRLDEAYLVKAREYADKVFELEQDSPHGHVILALLGITGGSVKQSIGHFKQVLDAEPRNPDALGWLAVFYAFYGQRTEVDLLVSRLSETDPFHPFVSCTPGILRLYVGEFESAVDIFRQAYRRHTEVLWIPVWYVIALAYVGRYQEASRVIDRLAEGNEANLAVRMCVILRHAMHGEKQDVLEAVSPDLKRWAEKDFNFSQWLADCYGLVDERDQAIRWVENAVNRGFINYPFLNEYDPCLKNIRADNRFRDLMTRVKHEWEQFRASCRTDGPDI